ncbi:hypothetical protein D3C86_1393170 [compost metagenome]
MRSTSALAPSSTPCRMVRLALKVEAGTSGLTVYCSNWSRTRERYTVRSQPKRSTWPRVPASSVQPRCAASGTNWLVAPMVWFKSEKSGTSALRVMSMKACTSLRGSQSTPNFGFTPL